MSPRVCRDPISRELLVDGKTPAEHKADASMSGPKWKLVPATATRDWAYLLANARQGQSSTPRCESPGEYDIGVAKRLIDEVLAASPTPPKLDREKVARIIRDACLRYCQETKSAVAPIAEDAADRILAMMEEG